MEFTERIEYIANRIKYLRYKKSISQSKLAEDLNISRVSMSYYETGSRCPDIDLLIKMADYFDCSLDYLTSRSDIKSIDTDIQAVCEYTGLSEEAVDILRNAEHNKTLNVAVLNHLISSFGDYEYENNKYRCVLSKIADFFNLGTNKIYYFKPSENSIIEYDGGEEAHGIMIENEDILIRESDIEELLLKEINSSLIQAKHYYKEREQTIWQL